MAVPLRIGGGSRLKILEALAARPAGRLDARRRRGAAPDAGRDFVVVESAEDMAAALLDAIRHPDQARRWPSTAAQVVRERYDWDVLADKLEAVWERGRSQRSAEAARARYARRPPDGVAVLRRAGTPGARPRASLPPDYRTTFPVVRRARPEPAVSRTRRAQTASRPSRCARTAPHFLRAADEIAEHLRRLGADVLCCSGYKPDLIGWLAARRAGVPVVSISHGWTAAT